VQQANAGRHGDSAEDGGRSDKRGEWGQLPARHQL